MLLQLSLSSPYPLHPQNILPFLSGPTAGSPYHGGQRPPADPCWGSGSSWGAGGWRGVQTWVREEVCRMHAGTGLPASCLLPVCHSVLPSGWEGPRRKKKKKNPAGYSLAFPGGAGAPRRRERPGTDREGLGNIASDFLCEYFLNFKLHLHKPGYSGKQITLGKLDSKSSVQSLL